MRVTFNPTLVLGGDFRGGGDGDPLTWGGGTILSLPGCLVGGGGGVPNLDFGALDTTEGLTGRAGLLKNVLDAIGDNAEKASIACNRVKTKFSC